MSMVSSNYLIQTEDLNVSMKGVPILTQINLACKPGTIYGLLGPNGAGKTTLLKVLLGIYKPTSGKVIFDGHDLYETQAKGSLRSIGSIIEFPGFYDHLTLYENLELHLRYQGKIGVSSQEIDELLKRVSLDRHRNKRFAQTSLGMKQRLGIARAMAHQPKMLLLDEPTNGLDPQGIIEVRETLMTDAARRGTTVIVSSHILSEIRQMADELIIMNEGTIVYQTGHQMTGEEVESKGFSYDEEHSLEDLYLNSIRGSQSK